MKRLITGILSQGGSGSTDTIMSNATLPANLVSYWKCDTSGTFTDIHGTNTGTINGATYTSSGKINGGYSYDGTNDYVELSSLPGYSAFSFSLWIKRADLDQTSYILDQPSGTNHAYALYELGTDRMGFRITNTSNIQTSLTSSVLFNDTNWHHVVCTFDKDLSSNRMKIYVDGTLDVQSDATSLAVISVTNKFKLCAIGDLSSTLFFKGVIDEFGIWTKALTSTEVSSLYGTGSGLPYDSASNDSINTHSTLKTDLEAAFSANSDGTYKDLTGNGNDCTINGATYNSSGKLDGCYTYDGSNDYVNKNTILDLSAQTVITIAAWVKPTASNDYVGCVIGTKYSGEVYLRQRPDGYFQAGMDKGSAYRSMKANSAYSLDTWYHLIGVYKDGTTELYINNVAQTTSGLSGTPTFSTLTGAAADNFYCGAACSSTSNDTLNMWFDGDIDQVLIYTKELTSSERSDLYNSGDGLSYYR